jgi:probable F420-dependent oxidoreductase
VELGVFGLGRVTDPAVLGALAEECEQAELDSLWMGEHVVYPTETGLGLSTPETPILDPLVALAFVAARTTRLRLGTGVLILPQRQPVALAKELASLDRLAAGRLVVGLGVGYLDAELRALGVDPATRGRRADEAITALRLLWTDPQRGFDGRWVSWSGVDAHPRPLRPGGPPLVIGGRGAAAFRRAARVGDGWYGFLVDPAQVAAAVVEITREAEAVGRAWSGEVVVTPSVPLDAASVAAYRRAGATHLVVWPRDAVTVDEWRAAIAAAASVVPLVRAA